VSNVRPTVRPVTDRYHGLALDAAGVADVMARANRGDPEAQFILGAMHKIGSGVHRDLSMTVRWWQTAALNGHADAQVQLALLHELGNGVPRDPAAAIHLYRSASDAGHVEAHRYLARLLWEGNLVAPDRPAAVALWEKASARGDSAAKYNLAQAYWHGLHVRRDRRRAVELCVEVASDSAGWAAIRQRSLFQRGKRRALLAVGVLGLVILLICALAIF
jgi:TPR repeat protein